MKIAYRLFLGFGLLILMTIVLGITALSEIQKLAGITDAIYQHPLTVGYAVRDLRMDIVALNHSMETVASANTAEQIKEAALVIENYKKQGNKNFDIVFNNFLGNMDEIENAYRLFNEWEVMLDEVIELNLQGNRDAAADLIQEKGARQVKLLMAETDKVVAFATAKADSFLSHAKTVHQRIKFTIRALLSLMVIMAMIGSILISRSIVKPLGIIVEKIKNLSHGNLREKVDIYSKDEIGILADSFRGLQKDLIQRTGLLEQIASGDFSTDILPRSEDDDLGKSFFDMTSTLRKTQEELDNSIRKLRNIMDTVTVGIAVSTYDGELIDVNSACIKMFGFDTREEFQKYPASEYFYDPEDRNKFLELINKEGAITFDLRLKRRDNSFFWGSVSVISYQTDEHSPSFISSFMDITESKKAEKALERERNIVLLLQEITAAANESSTLDEAMQVCLDEVCTLMDWPVGHVYMPADDGTGLLLPTELWHIDNPEKFTTLREATVRSTFQPGIGLPGRIMDSRRSAWIVDVNADPDFTRTELVDNLGVKAAFGFPVLFGNEVVAVLEFFSKAEMEPDDKLLDVVVNIGKQLGRVVERSRTEETLKTAKKEAEAANRAKSEFLSGMSHELRTPLNAVLGFSQVLDGEFDGKLSKLQKGYVHTILESGNHLMGLINDILDLSKIEAGKVELFIEPLDIEELVNNSLTMIKTRSSEQHISLKMKLDELVKNTTIYADGRKLKQIMYNLLSNAVKFSSEGGSILVEASIISGNLRVSVKDSGIGINKEDQDKIFQKFFQTEGGLIHKTKGTGLGLNIVKNLVELHGGKLKVQSEGKNKGTTFTFTIPLDEHKDNQSENKS